MSDKPDKDPSEAINRIENRIESMKNKDYHGKNPRKNIKKLILKQKNKYSMLFDKQLSKSDSPKLKY